MTTEGWVCPICHAGVAPSCVRCPCADRTDSGPTFTYLDLCKRVHEYISPTSPHDELKCP